jgi:hypothetical protein
MDGWNFNIRTLQQIEVMGLAVKLFERIILTKALNVIEQEYHSMA